MIENEGRHGGNDACRKLYFVKMPDIERYIYRWRAKKKEMGGDWKVPLEGGGRGLNTYLICYEMLLLYNNQISSEPSRGTYIKLCRLCVHTKP